MSSPQQPNSVVRRLGLILTLVGVGLTEVLYGCGGDAVVESLVKEHIGPTSEDLLWGLSEEGYATDVRRAMTWKMVEQRGGYAHVAADAKTDPYVGDTPIDQYLPALCVLVDGRAAPTGITFDSYNGWLRGAVQATQPVQGYTLSSLAKANALCAETFGSGWRFAEFHDGRYGPTFSTSSGWSFWGAGQLTLGSRFWVSINDQPANPWNSVAPDDAAAKAYFQQAMQPLLTLTQNPQFRNLVYTAVSRQFDGDDNVLLRDVLQEAQQAGIINTSSPAWQSLVATVAKFDNINGTTYHPQIYIPNFSEGTLTRPNGVVVTVYETDLAKKAVPAYQLDASGNLVPLSQLIDETYAETHEVWVLSLNERVGLDQASMEALRTMDEEGLTSRKPRTRGGNTPKRLSPGCNPTGLRNNKGLEYLANFRIPDPSSVEHWLSGKLEPRVIIIGKGATQIANRYLGKHKRKDVKSEEGIIKDMFLTTWDRAQLGDYWVYKWVEIDGGPHINEISLGLSAPLKAKIEVSATFNVKASFEKKHDDIGEGSVYFEESTYLVYTTGNVDWTVCTQGGEGGTGNDNLALSAIAAASSTYPYESYSAARVKDGSQSTALGGANSWVNADAYAPNGYLPQWVQLDFGVNKTFSRVVVYTTASHPIQDFQIQYFDGISWKVVDPVAGIVSGNTAASVTRTFPAKTARLVRILGTRGPNHQPQYVRVNEFEVYQ